MKKVLALLLSALMVLSLASVSFAANLKELDTVGNMAVESALSINKDGSTYKEIKATTSSLTA